MALKAVITLSEPIVTTQGAFDVIVYNVQSGLASFPTQLGMQMLTVGDFFSSGYIAIPTQNITSVIWENEEGVIDAGIAIWNTLPGFIDLS